MNVLSLSDVMRMKKPSPVADGSQRSAEVIVFPGLNVRFSPAMLAPAADERETEPA